MIRIYGVPFSRTFRCLWMLEELGVPYEHVPVNHRFDEQKSPEYTRLNPNQHIPTLVDGDLVLWESMAINLYLADKYDGGMRPGTPEGCALACQWSFWGQNETEELLVTVLRHRIMYPEEHREPARAEAAAAALSKPFGVLEGALAERAFLVQDSFTVADLNVAHLMTWWTRAQLDFSAFPAIKRWLEACVAREAYQRIVANRGSMTGTYRQGWQYT